MADITVTIAAYEIATESELDYLLGSLRAHLGDVAVPYQFSDGLLRRALVDSVKSLTKRWQTRYTVVPSGIYDQEMLLVSGVDYSYWYVTRTLNGWLFPVDEPPIILVEDERPIVLQAAISIKSGLLQRNVLSFGSWRDDEISVSNIAGGDKLEKSIERDQRELDEILPPRSRKLAHPRKQSLVGFSSTVLNIYEGTSNDPSEGNI